MIHHTCEDPPASVLTSARSSTHLVSVFWDAATWMVIAVLWGKSIILLSRARMAFCSR